ncbi:hypothetical protein O9H85_18120 [Paenibacillus filicis]|uniref:Uncharacterized protein n=1 Tax=Paenibacillus gyeongsangnamensis TaxID=3388067 RepID=A0ABT4QBP4_9BACL|nr:hypothetical protein [Paenibacillus filicis]MCZ8514309.1 hypothetical protein [Paenibacillus filicis]
MFPQAVEVFTAKTLVKPGVLDRMFAKELERLNGLSGVAAQWSPMGYAQ